MSGAFGYVPSRESAFDKRVTIYEYPEDAGGMVDLRDNRLDSQLQTFSRAALLIAAHELQKKPVGSTVHYSNDALKAIMGEFLLKTELQEDLNKDKVLQTLCMSVMAATYGMYILETDGVSIWITSYSDYGGEGGAYEGRKPVDGKPTIRIPSVGKNIRMLKAVWKDGASRANAIEAKL